MPAEETRIAVITDSTCDIPPRLASGEGITIVPLYVRFGSEVLLDGIDIESGEFLKRLYSSLETPHTSQPSPGDFEQAYRRALESSGGAVSIHISSKISGTYESALMGKALLPGGAPVEVVDSGLNSAGLAIVVRAAARRAAAGGTLLEVKEEAVLAGAQTKMLGYFDTLEFMVRGGRVSKAAAVVSRAISVKPLMSFSNGEIVRAGVARNLAGAVTKLKSFISSNLPALDIAIAHSAVPEKAAKLAEAAVSISGIKDIPVLELGPVLSTHGGAGVLLAAVRSEAAQNKEL